VRPVLGVGGRIPSFPARESVIGRAELRDSCGDSAAATALRCGIDPPLAQTVSKYRQWAMLTRSRKFLWRALRRGLERL